MIAACRWSNRLDPLRLGAWNGSSFALFSLGRYEEGCASAMKSMQIVKDAHTLVAYIVNAVNGGRTVEAGEAATQLLKLQPDFRASHVEQAFPVRSSSERSRMTSALREAGLPD
jgi:adenylate cyclase